jgi:hypothetical protein
MPPLGKSAHAEQQKNNATGHKKPCESAKNAGRYSLNPPLDFGSRHACDDA